MTTNPYRAASPRAPRGECEGTMTTEYYLNREWQRRLAHIDLDCYSRTKGGSVIDPWNPPTRYLPVYVRQAIATLRNT